MVTRLIYYNDTASFFDKYYDEIEQIRQTMVEDGVLTEWPDGDLKNRLSWLAFEEVARRMVDDILELDV